MLAAPAYGGMARLSWLPLLGVVIRLREVNGLTKGRQRTAQRVPGGDVRVGLDQTSWVSGWYKVVYRGSKRAGQTKRSVCGRAGHVKTGRNKGLSGRSRVSMAI
jgi:hypothetical protein